MCLAMASVFLSLSLAPQLNAYWILHVLFFPMIYYVCFIILSFLYFCLYLVYELVRMCHSAYVEVRGQLAGINSLLLARWF